MIFKVCSRNRDGTGSNNERESKKCNNRPLRLIRSVRLAEIEKQSIRRKKEKRNETEKENKARLSSELIVIRENPPCSNQ